MNKQDLAAQYLQKMQHLLEECLETEKKAPRDARERLYKHNQYRIDRVLNNYEERLRGASVAV